LQDALNALTPGTDEAPFFRFRIYKSLSQWAQGRNDKAEALRYAEMSLGAARENGNPSFIASAQLHLARVQRWRGELSEALELTEESLVTSRRLNIEFDVVNATALKVQLLVELGLRDEAQATYQELLASGIKGGDAYYDIGLTAYKTFRDLDGAEQAYRLCLKQQPKHVSAWDNLAYALYDKDEIDEAVRCWRESLKLRNENADALAGLAIGLWTQGHCDEAVKIFRQALNLEPRYSDPTWLSGEPFWSQKAIEAARPLIAAARL
jgi:tetratricopeptide (TPR) repeat protein